MKRPGNWMTDFFPEGKRAGKLSEYPVEKLPGMYLYDLNMEYVGKILKTRKGDLVLSNGETVKRTTWPLYMVRDRPPE